MKLRSNPLVDDPKAPEWDDVEIPHGSNVNGTESRITCIKDSCPPPIVAFQEIAQVLVETVHSTPERLIGSSEVESIMVDDWKKGLEFTVTTSKIQKKIEQHFCEKKLTVQTELDSSDQVLGKLNLSRPELMRDLSIITDEGNVIETQTAINDQDQPMEFTQDGVNPNDNTLSALNYVLNSLVSVFEMLKGEVQSQTGSLLELIRDVTTLDGAVVSCCHVVKSIQILNNLNLKLEITKQGLDLSATRRLLVTNGALEESDRKLNQEILAQLCLLNQRNINALPNIDHTSNMDDTPLSESILEEFRRLANVDEDFQDRDT